MKAASRHPVRFFWIVWAAIGTVGVVASIAAGDWKPAFGAILWGWTIALVAAIRAYRSRPPGTPPPGPSLANVGQTASDVVMSSGYGVIPDLTSRPLEDVRELWRAGSLRCAVARDGSGASYVTVDLGGAPIRLMQRPAAELGGAEPDRARVRLELARLAAGARSRIAGSLSPIDSASPIFQIDPLTGLTPEQRRERQLLEQYLVYVDAAIKALDSAPAGR